MNSGFSKQCDIKGMGNNEDADKYFGWVKERRLGFAKESKHKRFNESGAPVLVGKEVLAPLLLKHAMKTHSICTLFLYRRKE